MKEKVLYKAVAVVLDSIYICVSECVCVNEKKIKENLIAAYSLKVTAAGFCTGFANSNRKTI